jgi:hypothetical protein
MAMEYRMIDDVTLSNFRRFMQSGVPLKEFGPQGAFDSKPRARDDDPDDKPAPSAIAGMLALRDRMSPEGFKALCDELCGGEAAEDGDPASQFSSPEAREKPEAQRAQDRKAKGAMDMAFDGRHAASRVARGPLLQCMAMRP